MLALSFAKKIQEENPFYALYVSIFGKQHRVGKLLLLPDFH